MKNRAPACDWRKVCCKRPGAIRKLRKRCKNLFAIFPKTPACPRLGLDWPSWPSTPRRRAWLRRKKISRVQPIPNQLLRRRNARNEQAVIERKLGKPQDALVLYDEVLKSDAAQSEKREALCGKGDIFFEMGGNANYQQAIQIYDQLASDKNEPVHWRNQALFKKALCLEKKNDRAGELETFYKILEDEGRPSGNRVLFWYYKAGCNAARLSEEDSKWESAAAIYERLVAAGGDRSEEAKARLNHLRLEHFLWAD